MNPVFDWLPLCLRYANDFLIGSGVCYLFICLDSFVFSISLLFLSLSLSLLHDGNINNRIIVIGREGGREEGVGGGWWGRFASSRLFVICFLHFFRNRKRATWQRWRRRWAPTCHRPVWPTRPRQPLPPPPPQQQQPPPCRLASTARNCKARAKLSGWRSRPWPAASRSSFPLISFFHFVVSIDSIQSNWNGIESIPTEWDGLLCRCRILKWSRSWWRYHRSSRVLRRHRPLPATATRSSCFWCRRLRGWAPASAVASSPSRWRRRCAIRPKPNSATLPSRSEVGFRSACCHSILVRFHLKKRKEKMKKNAIDELMLSQYGTWNDFYSVKLMIFDNISVKLINWWTIVGDDCSGRPSIGVVLCAGKEHAAGSAGPAEDAGDGGGSAAGSPALGPASLGQPRRGSPRFQRAPAAHHVTFPLPARDAAWHAESRDPHLPPASASGTFPSNLSYLGPIPSWFNWWVWMGLVNAFQVDWRWTGPEWTRRKRNRK